VTTWIFGIARNLAFNEMRKMKHADAGELTDTMEDESSFSEFDTFENKQLVQTALTVLPVKQREVMDLVFFHDLNYNEVAEVLNIPENTVKTRVLHAKAALKDKLLRMKGMVYGKQKGTN
jgi:RNA polymerase sigma-70 factor (ECF subfamily)